MSHSTDARPDHEPGSSRDRAALGNPPRPARPRFRRRLLGAAAAAASLPVALLVSTPAAAQVEDPAVPSWDTMKLDTTLPLTFNGEPVVVPKSYQPSAARARATASTPPVGTQRTLLAIRQVGGSLSLLLKPFTLRGVGEKIEVWVANDLSFPPGDCRNEVPGSIEVTDEQVQSLITEFDTNIYPKETTVFSTPPDRDGTNELFSSLFGIPLDFTGDGDKTLALVDNVQDDNYFDLPNSPTYIAGFHFSLFNELMDRNVMTIDSYDWLHRTGANPPNDPTDDPCTSRPARPRLYEGTFAHEWQHLLHYYTDPNETTWLNEGLSDVAQTLVGYVDPRLTIDQIGHDSHIICYQGWGTVLTPANPNPRDCNGAQNSLNLWDEGPAAGVLADYGHAFQLLLYLYDHFGQDILTRLHTDGDRQGIASLDAALDAEGVADPYAVLHDFQASTLLDRVVDTWFGIVLGEQKGKVTSASVNSLVNLDNPRSYEQPGAAPNGADYVLLRKADGTPLKGKDLRSLTFDGARTLPPQPLAWTVVDDDPDRPGNPVLWSGDGPWVDAFAVAEVTVPASDPTLRFVAKYGAEQDFDYWFVYVSTDGGESYTNVTDTAIDNPRVSESSIGLGPGISGTTDGFEEHAFDLSAYAGQTVLLGLRYVSDPLVFEGGLLVDDITVGGTVVSDGSSLAPFRSPTQIRPTPVHNFAVQVWGVNRDLHLAVRVAEVTNKFSFSLGLLERLVLALFPEVVVIVAYDEPTEQVTQYAPYTLTANGVVQGGGAA